MVLKLTTSILIIDIALQTNYVRFGNSGLILKEVCENARLLFIQYLKSSYKCQPARLLVRSSVCSFVCTSNDFQTIIIFSKYRTTTLNLVDKQDYLVTWSTSIRTPHKLQEGLLYNL